MHDSDDPVAPHRRVAEGDVVGFRYLIRSDAGQVLAVSAEVQYYLHGSDAPQPQALASRMEGRRDGERFTTSLSHTEAFGSGDHPKRQVLTPDQFPDLLDLAPGARVDATTPDGETVSISVVEAARGEVLLDHDHPLAGRQLTFEISIVSIRVASDAELSDGRPSLRTEGDGGTRASRGVAVNAEAMQKARGQLLALRAALASQFSDEEGRGGLFEDLVANASRNHGRVRELSSAHTALLARLDAIVARVEREGGRFDHRPALEMLVAQLERHEVAKSTLLQDSLAMDVGGEG